MELFRKAFKGNHSKLVNEVDVDHGLWIELKSRNVLTDQQLSDCKNEVCHYWLLCKIFVWVIPFEILYSQPGEHVWIA